MTPAQATLVARLDALDAEARSLRAQLAEAEQPALEGRVQVLLVRIGDGVCALPVEPIAEVVPRPKLAPIPEAPPWVPGVLDRAGVAWPALDVLARFERRARPAEVTDRVVLAQALGRNVALIVQEVIGLKEFDGARLDLSTLRAAEGPSLTALLDLEGTRVPMLSVARLVHASALPEAKP